MSRFRYRATCFRAVATFSFLSLAYCGLVKRPPTAAIRQDFADPSILLDGSTWYAYATGGKNVQVARANAFEGPWTLFGNGAMGSLPGCVDHVLLLSGLLMFCIVRVWPFSKT
jgi:hypothetical protein